MQTPIRIGVIGLVNDRIWQDIEEALATPDVEIVAGAEVNDRLRLRFGERIGCPEDALFLDGAQMLEAVPLQAVLVGMPTGENAHIVEVCAQHRVGVMLQKPMATSLDEADVITTAVQRSSIPFMVNIPEFWTPAVREATLMARDGKIGTLSRVYFRAAHAGPAEIGCSEEMQAWLFDPVLNPGGALLDLCSYGAQLSAWLLGKPESVVGVGANFVKKDLDVYDTGVLVMKYRSALSLCEGSWTDVGGIAPQGPAFTGSRGSIVIQGDSLLLVEPENPDGRRWTPEASEAQGPHGVAYFLSRLANGRSIDAPFGLTTSRDAQEILEAGFRSNQTGMECPLPVR